MKFRAQSRIFSKGVLSYTFAEETPFHCGHLQWRMYSIGLLTQLYENKGLNLLALIIVDHLAASYNY